MRVAGRPLAALRRVAVLITGRYAVLLALAVVWEAVARLALVDPLLLPPLSVVLARASSLAQSGTLPLAISASLVRVLAGTGAALAGAVPIGIALGLWPRVEHLVRPALGLLRPLSSPAWIPLAILWFGIGDRPAVFIIFVGTFPAILLGTLAAARSVDPHLVDAALTLGAGRRQAVRHVVLPALLPALLTQIRLALALGWMCVIAAEMVAVRQGIGYLMIEARAMFRTEDVIAGMLVVGLTGLALDALLIAIESRACRWRGPAPASRRFDLGPLTLSRTDRREAATAERHLARARANGGQRE